MGLPSGAVAGPSGITPGTQVTIIRHFNNGISKEVARGTYVRGNTGMAIVRFEDGTEHCVLLRDGIAFTHTLVIGREEQ